MDAEPKITIITPTLNSGNAIEACIRSVAGQKYKNIEHLIVDGLSTDKTLDIVQNYAKQYPHIRFVSEKDIGIYDAMNKGIDLANGEWIYFLGSDDLFHSETVLEEIFGVEGISQYDFVYGNVIWGDTGTLYDGKFSLLKLMEKNICHQAIIYKKELFYKLGKFDTDYKTWADWLFNIKCFTLHGIKINYIDIVLAKFAFGGHSSLKVVDDYFINNKEKLFKTYFTEEYIDINNRLCRIETELTEKRHLVDEQANQLSEKDALICALNNRIDALLGSFSWRVTRPVRALADLFMPKGNK
ncbi:MAG: glycosyltransferase [Geobacter sp.]|nr:glycosyltransferase [Geobacter sp.]